MIKNVQHMWIGLFTWFYVLTVVYSEDQPAAPPNPLAQLDLHFYNKCWQATGNVESFSKLRNATSDLFNYFGSTIELLPDHKKQFCEYERSELNKRILTFSKHLKVCLPETEKFIASFLRDSFKEFLHFVCHNNAENVDRFFSGRARHCRTTLLDSNEGGSFSNCLSRIFAPVKGPDGLTQTEACEDVTILKKCFNTVLMEKCPSYEPYRALNDDLFKYISKPCGSPSGSVSYLGSVSLLTVSFIAPYLLSR